MTENEQKTDRPDQGEFLVPPWEDVPLSKPAQRARPEKAADTQDNAGVTPEQNTPEAAPEKKHRSRRTRRSRPKPPPAAAEGTGALAETPALPALPEDEAAEATPAETPATDEPQTTATPETPAETQPAKRPRRRHRSSRSRKAKSEGTESQEPETPPAEAGPAVEESPEPASEETASTTLEPDQEQDKLEAEAPETQPARRPRRRRRSSRSRKPRSEGADSQESEEQPDETRPDEDEEPAFASEESENDDLEPEQDEDDLDEDADDSATRPQAKARTQRRRKMYVSVLPDEQVEVALSEDGRVQEYYVEMLHQAKIKGNIYKGVISNIDPALQAAFVNYGGEKNGFLQIDEVHEEYYLTPHDHSKGHRFPLIQKVLKPGMDILVQVVKEPAGSKGAFLTTYLSLAGRYIVLTPGRKQVGISRKIEDEGERSYLKGIADSVDPGLGIILRTASAGAKKNQLSKDVLYLKRLWKEITTTAQEVKAPALIYQEPGLAERAVRDYLTEDVSEVWVDHPATAERVANIAALIYPRRTSLVKTHNDPERTLWERFSIQRQIAQIHSREVTLPSGGRLVFDQTEALMAVDINSGKFSGKNFQEMAYKTNMEAAVAIAEQLRMRDVGGQVVIDFIEIKDQNHCREVEKALKNALKRDRARHDVSKMSKFGLLQLVRQRLGSSSMSISSEPCPYCHGSGSRRNMEWQAMQALKEIYRKLSRSSHNEQKTAPEQKNGQDKNHGHERLEYRVSQELAIYLLNHKRAKLLDMEHDSGISISIVPE